MIHSSMLHLRPVAFVAAFTAALAVASAVTPAPVRAQTGDSLHLAALQRAARTRDPRTAQARLLNEQSRLRLENLRAERLPTLAINGQAQHQSDVTSVPFPGAIAPYNDTYDANLAARVRLFDPSLAPRRDAERAQLAESEARVEVALYAQRQLVNDAFFTALLLQGQGAVLQQGIDDLDAQLRLAKERVSAGAALPSEAAIVEAELLRRRQSLDETDAGRRVALAVLGDLSGLTFRGDEPLAIPALESAVTTMRASIDSLRTRPEYTQFERSRALLDARRATIAAQQQVRVAAFGRTGYGRPGLNQLAREFDSYWLAGVQVEWSPFDWGTVRREREALVLQQQVLATEESAFAERLRRSTLADVTAVDRLTRALATDDAIIALRVRVLDETRLRVREGVVVSAEYIDRETDLTAARLARATHVVELAQARARFLNTVGLEVR